MTNRKAEEVAYALSIGTKIIDLGWLWTAISPNFLGILHYFTTNEDGPALSATEFLHTESTFQPWIDDVDIAWILSEERFSDLCPI